jgi:hypothetical protein
MELSNDLAQRGFYAVESKYRERNNSRLQALLTQRPRGMEWGLEFDFY